jgi:hypothetical protein
MLSQRPALRRWLSRFGRSTPYHTQRRVRAHDTPVTFLESLFAGRNTELEMLAVDYGRAAAGQPGVLTLHGEA